MSREQLTARCTGTTASTGASCTRCQGPFTPCIDLVCFNFYFKAEEKSREAERKDREAEAADREVRMWERGCSGFIVHGVDELFQWTSSDAQSVQVTEGTQALHGLTNRILENGRKRSLH